jgi:hypothetical protein
MFLGNVLFLTGVWHYSILRAGMAISVGPLIVAITAPLFGKLADGWTTPAADTRRARVGSQRTAADQSVTLQPTTSPTTCRR